MKWIWVVLAVAAVVAIGPSASLAQEASHATEEAASEAPTRPTSTPTTVFVCADSGDLSGAHELGFLHAALEDRQELSLTHCQSVYVGFLTHADGHRFHAIAATTGIGFVSAAVCTQSLLALQEERELVFEAVVLVGTSGFSPFVGGWDPTNTTAAAVERRRQERAAIDGLAANSAVAAEPIRKFQTKSERDRDAARDLLRAVQRGSFVGVKAPPADDSVGRYREEEDVEAAGNRPDGMPRRADVAVKVGGIPSNVNWERVRSGQQIQLDGCSPMATAPHPPSPALTGLKYNQRLSIGSICVTSAAFMQETGTCTETLTTNQCGRPNCNGFTNIMSTHNAFVARNTRSLKLTSDIVAASAGKPFPPPPPVVRDGMRAFWRHNEAAAKAPGHEDADLAPSFVVCAESTMNAIAAGAQLDFLCRERTAQVLNVQHRAMQRELGGSQDGDSGPTPYTADNVVCVQAMEAFGVLESMSRSPDIPVAVIRAASNYDMFPQQKLYVPARIVNRRPAAVEATGSNSTSDLDREDPVLPYVWRQNPDYVSQQEYDEFVHASFHYSVRMATFVISNYFLGGRDLSQLTSPP